MQATLEALSAGDGAEPADLRDGRGDRQARRQLPHHRRPVRPVRPRAAVRHADQRARLRRPRLRRGHDRHAAGDRLHVRRLRPRRRRRDRQPDRQDAVHEQRPARRCRSCCAAASASAIRPPRTTPATTTRCTPTSPACAWSCPRRPTTPRGCCTAPCAATTRCSSSNTASCWASKGRSRRRTTRSTSARRPWSARARDVTVVALALMVHHTLKACETLAKEGISVELIDPRTVAPLDVETIARSVAQDGPAADRGRGVRARSASAPRSPPRSPTAASTTSTRRSAGSTASTRRRRTARRWRRPSSRTSERSPRPIRDLIAE